MRGDKYKSGGRTLGLRVGAAAALGAFTANGGAADPDKSVDRVSTTTPIKHVIVILAENSSFDHAFGAFRPREDQHIANLLSKGIVNADGTPGPNFSKAAQFTSVAAAPIFHGRAWCKQNALRHSAAARSEWRAAGGDR
jgi:phospholipase C